MCFSVACPLFIETSDLLDVLMVFSVLSNVLFLFPEDVDFLTYSVPLLLVADALLSMVWLECSFSMEAISLKGEKRKSYRRISKTCRVRS